VLQRINGRVFPSPRDVVRNTARVVAHVERHSPGLVPALIPARSGQPGVETTDGVFRMLAFVSGGEAGVAPLDAAAARAAGDAFGRFQAALAGYDPSTHRAPIPGFLELTPCFARLDAVLVDGEIGRRRAAENEIAEVNARRGAIALAERGPLGMIHADGKVSNLLFARGEPRVLAVLDLDTVMMGRRAWDFGDLVRSAAARGAEDEAGLALDLELFEPLAQGFVAGLGSLYDADLARALVTAPRYVTLTLAVRFLADYLAGDRYFRVDDPSHNLRRARAQLALVRSEERLEHDMARILGRLQ
jgi:Ser/Thr protein kinase RdoA (MazF antagonist)